MKGVRVELRFKGCRLTEGSRQERPMLSDINTEHNHTQRHRIPGNPQVDTTSYRYAVSLFPSFIFTGSEAEDCKGTGIGQHHLPPTSRLVEIAW